VTARKERAVTYLPHRGEFTMERIIPLDLEVVEIERSARPGCGGSSSTNPRCTCPVVTNDE
jgi:hypothetical protein